MSNRATIQRTIFTNVPSGEQSFGYRIYDDHGQDYCNNLAMEDLILPDQKFLNKIHATFSEVANSVFDGALDKGGIYIDDNWYTLTQDEGALVLGKPINN